MKSALTPRELAESIGVSESSLKRWADAGLVQVSRTAGGHRRILLAEAVRFIRDRRLPVLRPERLGLSDVATVSPSGRAGESAADRLYTYLVQGQAPEARGLLVALYLSGSSIAAISDGPLHEALARIGGLWMRDERGIFIEHRAAGICASAVTQLHAMLAVPPGAPTAVGGAAPRDPGGLSSLVAAAVLASEGLRAVDLGASTPLEAIRHAAAELRAAIAWLSITHAVGVELRPAILELARELARLNCRLAVGGHQHAALGLSNGDNLFVGESMSELAAFARGVLTARAPAATAGPG